MPTYYVNPAGNNAWDGLAPEWVAGLNGPWKTMAKVTAFAFAAGDTCLFKRGSAYGYLKPGVSGANGNHIIFGAYGARSLGDVSFTGLYGNGKNYFTCVELYFSGDRLWLSTSETYWTFNYCFIGNNASTGLWGATCTNIVFNNCLFTRNANYHLSTSGVSTVRARNCIFVGNTEAVGAFNIQIGGSLDLDYCLIMGNSSNILTNASMTNVVDGGHNQWRLWPSFAMMPFEDSPRICFSFDDNAAIDSFEIMVNGIFNTYGVKATIYINPGKPWTAGEITKLLDFISKGHEVGNHGWCHDDLTATQAFVVTTTNTTPTIDVDVATTTIILWCDQVANRIIFDWSGNKTIQDLKTAVIGKNWTITNSVQNGKTRVDVLKLDCLADSVGPQVCPYTTLLDIAAPNYKFWDHEVNDAQNAIETTLGVRPKTMAYPYGFNNAALRTWIDANTDLMVARIVGGAPFKLASVPMWIFQGGGIPNPTTATEAEIYEFADHMMYWMKSTPGYFSLYAHSTTAAEQIRIEWFIERTQQRGATWLTLRALVEWIDSTHVIVGTNWTKTYTPTPDYHLSSGSPCLNNGTDVGLVEDYDGILVPQGIGVDIGIYEAPPPPSPTSFEAFVSLPDLEKLVIVEIQPRQEIQNKDWVYDIFSGVTIYGTSFTWGEPVRVTENAIDYYWKVTKDECYAVPGSFYFDPDALILWIHTSDGDAPNEILSGSVSGAGGSKYCILVYFWICLTNYQPKLPSADTPIIDFIPQDATLPAYYLPYLPGDALGSVRQAIGEYHVGDIIINDADLKCNNDGFWYKAINEFYFENAIIEAKVGDIRASYAELALFFTGFIRNKDVTDEQINFSCKDRRMGRFREIPELRFDRITYPQLEEGADGRVIPIPLGRCYGCNPTYIGQPAPGQWAYQPSAVQINALTVYKDGVLLVLGADYNENLVTGIFVLLADPLDSLITCDMEGVLCDMTTGLYSANIADLLQYLLVNLNGIPITEIDAPSFLALKAARGQTCGYWAGGDGNPVSSFDVLRLFQVTGMFHLIPNLSNQFDVRWFEPGSDSLTPIFYQDEFPLIGRRFDADRIRQKVIINYRYNPSLQTLQKYLSVEAVADKTIYRFSEHEIQTIITALVVQAEAESLASLHLDLLRFPGDYAFGRLTARALNMLPAEKVKLNKFITMETAEIHYVFNDAVYRLLQLDKNLETGEVDFLALNESQATGSYHADILHVDSYSDIPHGDGHGDDYVDEHIDLYDDVHTDFYDDIHGDIIHIDSHADHEDGGPYFDVYSDVPHVDAHTDRYWDIHDDFHVDTYSDTYSDSPHVDYLHTDSHSDVPHADAEY